LCTTLEIKVADSEGNPVPIGQQGEIWARGFPIMIGYYGDPEKINETITSSRWLRTDDIGKMDEDGYFYYIVHQKEMIIRGGVNIYPMEIENAINEHPNVSESQVFSIQLLLALLKNFYY
jgi:acyl-CoA synthetase (AMP-forming)/AMP-acid ligase II